MGYVILTIIIVALLIRLFLIEKEVKSVTDQIIELNENKTRKKITISLTNKNIERLSSAINQNLAKQERLQIDLKGHEERLKQSIANLSHDLRTPLTSIMGYVAMLKGNKDKVDEYLETVEHRVKALNGLINGFYEMSLVDDENYNIALEKIDIVYILTQSLMENYSLFEEKGIKPEINLPDRAIYIMGNAMSYERIFQNLIFNAIKYSSCSVSVNLKEQKDKCIFTISNRTEFLTDEDVAHIFERFYTADKSRATGGTGLGLYIVKSLAERMGCTVCSSLEDNVLSITIICHSLINQ